MTATVDSDTTADRVCIECGNSLGTLHGRGCRLDSSGGDYVDWEESRDRPQGSAAATAVVHMLDGGLVPVADPPDPIRRCELAVIWLQEATAELSDSIVAAKDSGRSFPEIGEALGMTAEGVRQRYVRIKAHLATYGG